MQTIKLVLIKIPSISLLTLVDKIFKTVFLSKTKRHYKKLGKPYGVIINNDLLKFHNNDLRKKIKKELLG